MGRSSAYWSSNLYTVEAEEPVPTAPLSDLSAPLAIATLANNRSSGYPRMAFAGNELLFAWLDRENGSIIRTASARLAGGSK